MANFGRKSAKKVAREPQNPKIILKESREVVLEWGFFLLILGLLHWLGKVNFSVFHIMAEMGSIQIGWCSFVISWNTRKHSPSKLYVSYGFLYFFVGIGDMLHTLTFRGIQVLCVPKSGVSCSKYRTISYEMHKNARNIVRYRAISRSWMH